MEEEQTKKLNSKPFGHSSPLPTRKELPSFRFWVTSKLLLTGHKKKVEVQNVCLGPFLQEIQAILQSFQWSSFRHIYRELNKKADELSKEALSQCIVSFSFTEFLYDHEIDAMEFYL
jgi:hypothetical protein